MLQEKTHKPYLDDHFLFKECAMSLEPMFPLCHGSIAPQAASWSKDFEVILAFQFSTLREIDMFSFVFYSF